MTSTPITRPGERRTSRRQFLSRHLNAMIQFGIATQAIGLGSAWADPLMRLRDDDSYSVSFPSMGSLIHVRWVADSTSAPEETLKSLQSVADEWVDVLSDYQQESHCMQFCRDADGLDWIHPSPPLWGMLLECDRWHGLSEGAFDAALGALTRLRRSQRPTTESQWQQAREQCGWQHIELNREDRLVRFRRSGLRLDFGAIGKGYVADRLGERLRELGIDRFVVNASGNMLCGDSWLDPTQPQPNTAGRLSVGDVPGGWPISIGLLQAPNLDLRRLRMARCGIATSGDQYQKFRDNPATPAERRTSHIVDPALGKGLEQACMASVIASTAADADAMATACCVHMQRGTTASWLSRHAGEFEKLELILQSRDAPGQPIRMTTMHAIDRE